MLHVCRADLFARIHAPLTFKIVTFYCLLWLPSSYFLFSSITFFSSLFSILFYSSIHFSSWLSISLNHSQSFFSLSSKVLTLNLKTFDDSSDQSSSSVSSKETGRCSYSFDSAFNLTFDLFPLRSSVSICFCLEDSEHFSSLLSSLFFFPLRFLPFLYNPLC